MSLTTPRLLVGRFRLGASVEIQVMAQCIRPGDVVLGRVVEKVRRTASAVHLYLKNEPEVRTVGPWATMTVWAGGLNHGRHHH